MKQAKQHGKLEQRRPDPGASTRHWAVLVGAASDVPVRAAEAFSKAPETWCRVRTAADHDPCTSSTTPSHCQAQPISADEDGQRLWLMLRQSPGVFCSFVRCGCLLLPFHRNGLGLSSVSVSVVASPIKDLVSPFRVSTPPLALCWSVFPALDWSILRKGCGGTMITT